ncbi:hypothetical protein QR685DRAFT_214120 [Neurospora intermedia]|uniref:Uncharacterized protein n=1 Tax=Neurospora intermedia TaxID=5142 RepID=A0ABR3DGQ5_NEUIN
MSVVRVVPDNHHCITEHCQRASSMQIKSRYCPLPIHSSPSRLSVSRVELCHYTFSTHRTPNPPTQHNETRGAYTSRQPAPVPFHFLVTFGNIPCSTPVVRRVNKSSRFPFEEKSQVRTPALSAWKEGYNRYQSTDQIFIGLRSFYPVSVGGKRKGSTLLSNPPFTRLFARLMFPRVYPLPRHLHWIL